MAQPLAQRFHGVVVGIDDYRSELFSPLRGAVADAHAVRDFLVESLGIPRSRVQTLTARSGAPPTGSDNGRPTYAAIVAALKGVVQRAAAQDDVLFYFSGHGGLTPTCIPQTRGSDGRDKFLAPADIETEDGLPLRDVELAHLIERLHKNQVRTTVVLDCCHSGGSLRSWEPSDVIRRGGRLDTLPRREGTVASPETLAQSWRRTRWSTRDAEIESGWRLPTYAVVAAACGTHEQAYEGSIGGVQRGLFTHWWLDTLCRWGLGRSYRRIHDRVLAQVQMMQDDQTPVLEGDGNRLLFGDERTTSTRGIVILDVRKEARQVVLDAGRAHGLAPGTILRLDLEASGQSEETTDMLMAIGDDLDGTRSIADILDTSDPLPEPGDRARLVDLGPEDGRRRIAIESESWGDGLPLPADLEVGIDASGFLTLVQSEADLYLRRAADTLQITSVTSSPLLSLQGITEATEVVEFLEHLARYRSIQKLENLDPRSKLTGRVNISLRRPPPDWQHGAAIQPHLGNTLESPVHLADGEILWLVIENTSPFPVHYAVFDLRPDWECFRLVPPDRAGQELAAGGIDAFAFRPRYVAGERPCRDILKLIASAESTDFSWLSLPRPGQESAAARFLEVGDPLQRLLAASETSMRDLAPRRSTAWLFWTTDEVIFEVQSAHRQSPCSSNPAQ